jgi:hypothetical protein
MDEIFYTVAMELARTMHAPLPVFTVSSRAGVPPPPVWRLIECVRRVAHSRGLLNTTYRTPQYPLSHLRPSYLQSTLACPGQRKGITKFIRAAARDDAAARWSE